MLELMNRQNKAEEQKDIIFMSSQVAQDFWEYLKEMEKVSEF